MTVLKWLVYGLPWVVLPYQADPFLQPKEAALLVGLWWCLAVWLGQQPVFLISWRNPWLTRWLVWVIGYGGYAFWWALLWRRPSATTVTFNWMAWSEAVNVATACVFVWALVTLVVSDELKARRLCQWLCTAATWVAGFALLQFIGLDQFFMGPGKTNLYTNNTYSEQRMVAALGNVNYTATYLALTAPLFLLFRTRRMLWQFVLVCVVIGLSNVKFAIAGTLLSAALYGWLRWSARRWWVWATAAVVGVGLVAGWAGRAHLTRDERWPIWGLTVQTWQAIDPQRVAGAITGHGLGDFVMEFQAKWPEKMQRVTRLAGSKSAWHWAHNDLLQGLHEFGLVGMTLLVGLFLNLWRRLWPHRLTAYGRVLVVALVNLVWMSLTNFPWHLAPCALTGLCLWALAEVQPLRLREG